MGPLDAKEILLKSIIFARWQHA